MDFCILIHIFLPIRGPCSEKCSWGVNHRSGRQGKVSGRLLFAEKSFPVRLRRAEKSARNNCWCCQQLSALKFLSGESFLFSIPRGWLTRLRFTHLWSGVDWICLIGLLEGWAPGGGDENSSCLSTYYVPGIFRSTLKIPFQFIPEQPGEETLAVLLLRDHDTEKLRELLRDTLLSPMPDTH